MDWIKWRDEIHQNAVDHGWWGECPPPAVRDEGGNEPNEAGSADAERTGDHAELRKGDRTTSEIVCLIISELMEALEEYRNNRPMVYGVVIYGEDEAVPRFETDMEEIRRLGLKPEGVAVELVDAVIRIHDYFGHVGYEPKDFDTSEYWNTQDIPMDLCDMLFEAIRVICSGFDHVSREIEPFYLWMVCVGIFIWIIQNGMDPEQIMELKHNYNKSRPYRHGGKRI